MAPLSRAPMPRLRVANQHLPPAYRAECELVLSGSDMCPMFWLIPGHGSTPKASGGTPC
jgi:hypothetical protein